jgi:hypothetical protein
VSVADLPYLQLRSPIIVPANMEVAGQGINQTIIQSSMLQPGVMRSVCAFAGGVCAVFTVDNISREVRRKELM